MMCVMGTSGSGKTSMYVYAALVPARPRASRVLTMIAYVHPVVLVEVRARTPIFTR